MPYGKTPAKVVNKSENETTNALTFGDFSTSRIISTIQIHTYNIFSQQ